MFVELVGFMAMRTSKVGISRPEDYGGGFLGEVAL